MLSISSLIQFLLDLLRDSDAQAEFARDPQAVLARHGLEGVTGQDVRDIAPMLADCQGVSRHDGSGDDGGGPRHHGDDDDPVRAIHHVTHNHRVDHDVVVEHHTAQPVYNEYNTEFHYYDHSVTTGDDSTVIQDSFNQDNDGVDNKGGIIVDSNVAGADQTDVGNSEETTTIEDSFDEDSSETIVVVDSNNDSSDHSTTVTDSFTVNNSYDVHAPTTAIDASDEAADDPAA